MKNGQNGYLEIIWGTSASVHNFHTMAYACQVAMSWGPCFLAVRGHSAHHVLKEGRSCFLGRFPSTPGRNMHHYTYIPHSGHSMSSPYVIVLRISCARKRRRCSNVHFRVIWRGGVMAFSFYKHQGLGYHYRGVRSP